MDNAKRFKGSGNSICKHCGMKFDDGRKLGGHSVSCKSNPNRNNWIKKVTDGHPRQNVSDETKSKIRKTINEKIKDGTWHNSFSKSRTHLYDSKCNGMVKLYGKWELNYAKWLDDNDILWRRPKENFYYEYENKGHRYTPDFYLIKQKQYVEVKGYKTPKDEAKWEWFPLELEILTGKELFKMGLIESYRKI